MCAMLGQKLVVSRETEDRLRDLHAMLVKWNPAINLVAKSTIPVAWERHVLDSVQLFPDTPFVRWVDLGSGGGFPGLVIAVLCAELRPESQVTLVEVDQRKAAFLREAARQLQLPAIVIAERIEAVAPLQADIMSARALAPLSDLLGFAVRHMKPDGLALFPKGASWRAEVEDARKAWRFDLAVESSETDPAAVILKVKTVEHV